MHRRRSPTCGGRSSAATTRSRDASRWRHIPGFALHDAQLTVARGYGFTGWPALVHYLEIAADLSVDPSRVDEDALDPADRFCALSALRYDDTDAPPRRQAAAEMLAAEPDLVDRHVWAAAAAADPAALRGTSPRDRRWRRRAGGPFGWVPLMYLCYSRASSSAAAQTKSSRPQHCCSTRAPTRTRATCGAGCRPRSPC